MPEYMKYSLFHNHERMLQILKIWFIYLLCLQILDFHVQN